MQESFLHFVWQFQYFDKKDLLTSEREDINIIQPGIYNTDSGPDFSDSKILMKEMLWHGHTEIHLKSSDWNVHNHQDDPAYNKVILHVVWDDDKPAFRSDGTAIPTIELKNRISYDLISKYNGLINYPDAVPCANQLPNVAEIIRYSMLDKALMQRIERKSRVARKLLVLNQNDWEKTSYQLLAQNFGFKVNSQAFFKLSEAVPLKIMQKQSKLVHLEALFFGQAGLLQEEGLDPYMNLLKSEYEFLVNKYSLVTKKLEKHEWRYLRMRPANFPPVRIAQFAALLHKLPFLFSFFKEEADYKNLFKILQVNSSDYWHDHYDFGKKSARTVIGLGKSSVENIIINTVIPLLVSYGHVHDEQDYIDRALDFMQNLPAENNRITRLWKGFGFNIKNGFDSQGVIEINNNFCSLRKCLECNIGTSLLKQSYN